MTQIEPAARTGSKQAVSGSATRFETLDSWRGICALLVAMMHFPVSGMFGESLVVRNAFLFVDYFFVLSGFVIAHGYSDRVREGVDLARFLVVRFGRIYPLHIAVLGLFVAFEALRWGVPLLRGDGAAPFTDGNSVTELLTSMALLNGLGIETQLTWNGPSWSISAEMWTYVLFGLALLALGRRLWIVLVPAIVAGPVILYLYSPHLMDATYDYGFVRCIYGFSLGALLHRLTISDLLRRRAAAVAAPGMSRLGWTIAEIAAVVAIMAFVAVLARGPWGLAAPVLFAAALWLFANERGLVSAALKRPAFLWLGALSYGIYMVHIFVQGRMINAATLAEKVTGLDLVGPFAIRGQDFYGFGVAGDMVAALAMAAMIAAVIAVALAAHFAIERPFQRLSRRLAARLGTQRAATPVSARRWALALGQHEGRAHPML